MIEYKVNLENEKQLKERIAKLDKRIKIKDDTENEFLFYNTIIEGTRYETKARYGKKQTKEEALEQICEKKQKLIKELTIHFE